MADPIRLPLLEDVEPRLSTSTKDGLTSNVFYDRNKQGTTYAVKRPGITSYISGTGLASGIFGWNNQLFKYEDTYSYWSCADYMSDKWVVLQDTNRNYQGLWTNQDTFNSSSTLYSTNGITWNRSTAPDGATHPMWVNVVNNGSVFCSVSTLLAGGTPHCATSSDGITWTSRTIDATISWYNIATNGTSFVAIGYLGATPKSATSSDGITWSVHTGMFGAHSGELSYGASLYVAGNGTGTKVQVSSDGITWTEKTIGGTLTQPFKISSSSSKILAYKNSTTTSPFIEAFISSDGNTWTDVSTAILDLNQVGITNLITAKCVNNIFYILAAEATADGTFPSSGIKIYYSSDGSTWAKADLPYLDSSDYWYSYSPVFYGLTSDGSKLIWFVNGPANRYLYSEDAGVTWTFGDTETFPPTITIT